jgi:DNA processing protein
VITPEHEARAALMRAADTGDAIMGDLVAEFGAIRALQIIRTVTLPEIPSALNDTAVAAIAPALRDIPRATAVPACNDIAQAATAPVPGDISQTATAPVLSDRAQATAAPAFGHIAQAATAPTADGTAQPQASPRNPTPQDARDAPPPGTPPHPQSGATSPLPGRPEQSTSSSTASPHQPQPAAPRAGQEGTATPGRTEPSGPHDTEALLDLPFTPELIRRLPIWQARLANCDPAADLEAGERIGARLIIPGDPEWPTQLDALGSARPLGLWLHGTADLRYSCLRSVAVVGARAATSYGVHVAAQFGVGLSEAGWTVVSGGAFGIDGAAHRGALAAGGPTVVVLACGVDYCYPSEHRSLFAAARDQGVLVSECPPGVRPTRARFLVRNRVIAALSRGTLVVEAAVRSGALNTANHTLALDRHLGAVPGPITSTLSDGCHRLLREGKAVCVTTPEEMIELVGVMGDDLAPIPRGPALPIDSLSERTRRVLDAVPARISAGPATIAVAAGVDLNAAISALGSLAAAGYVERTPNGWRARRPPSPVYRQATPADQPATQAARLDQPTKHAPASGLPPAPAPVSDQSAIQAASADQSVTQAQASSESATPASASSQLAMQAASPGQPTKHAPASGVHVAQASASSQPAIQADRSVTETLASDLSPMHAAPSARPVAAARTPGLPVAQAFASDQPAAPAAPSDQPATHVPAPDRPVTQAVAADHVATQAVAADQPCSEESPAGRSRRHGAPRHRPCFQATSADRLAVQADPSDQPRAQVQRFREKSEAKRAQDEGKFEIQLAARHEEAERERAGRQEVEPEGAERQEVEPEGPGRQEAKPEGAERQEVEPEGPGRQEVEPEGPGRQEAKPEGAERQEVEPEGPGRQEAKRHAATKAATRKLVAGAEQRAATAESCATKLTQQAEQTRREADLHTNPSEAGARTSSKKGSQSPGQQTTTPSTDRTASNSLASSALSSPQAGEELAKAAVLVPRPRNASD